MLDMRDHNDIYIYMVIRLLYVYDMMRFVLYRKPVYEYENCIIAVQIQQKYDGKKKQKMKNKYQ